VLPAGTAPKPIQIQDHEIGTPQPGGNFSCLKRSISGIKVPIQQLGYLLGGAWFLDSVQRSPYVLVETTIRIWQLAHQRFSGQETDLLRQAHSCSYSLRTAATRDWPVSTGERVCEWLQVRALGSASQSIRPLTSIRSFHPILPVLAGAIRR
jgi:hypothetical protein